MTRVLSERICKGTITFLIIVVANILLVSCDDELETTNSSVNKQVINIIVADSNQSTITYSDAYMEPSSETMRVTNNSKFPVELILVRQDKGDAGNEHNGEVSAYIEANADAEIANLDRKNLYEVGCRVDAEEGADIQLVFTENE